MKAYDAAHGRWLSRDSAGEAGGVNLYSYAAENPVGETNPTGEFGFVGLAVGIALDLGQQIFIENRSLKCVNVGEVILSGLLGFVLPGAVNVADAQLGFEAFLPAAYQGVGAGAITFAWGAGAVTKSVFKHVETQKCGC